MKKTSSSDSSIREMLPEYRFDYKKAKPNRFVQPGVSRVVVALDPDISEVFRTPDSVNTALRDLITNMPKTIRVLIDEALLCRSLGRDLHEGRWRKDSETGYMFRVDAANPGTRTDRHVTIAQPKHTSARNKQVSWADSGARHDKKTFDTGFVGLTQAKDLARRVLHLPAEVTLEKVSTLTFAVEQLLEGHGTFRETIEKVAREDDGVINFRVKI
jgi:Family of unknown function (DUF6367)